ncbi:MAG: DUF3458 domain-containing protein, partial [bacterium]
MRDAFDAATGRYTLHFQQATKPTPGQPEKHPQVIPVRLGLLDPQGQSLVMDDLFVLDGAEGQKFWDN